MSKYLPVTCKEPPGHLPDDEALLEKDGRIEVTLIKEDGQKLVVIFDDYVAYRKIDEGDAFRILNDISASGCIGHLLYAVEDSEFIEWFKKENYLVRNIDEMRHYCLTTSNSVIDVISFELPKISSQN